MRCGNPSECCFQIASASAISATESSPDASGFEPSTIFDTNASACLRNDQVVPQGGSLVCRPSSTVTYASASAAKGAAARWSGCRARTRSRGLRARRRWFRWRVRGARTPSKSRPYGRGAGSGDASDQRGEAQSVAGKIDDMAEDVQERVVTRPQARGHPVRTVFPKHKAIGPRFGGHDEPVTCTPGGAAEAPAARTDDTV